MAFRLTPFIPGVICHPRFSPTTVKETLIQIIESEEQAIEDYSDLIDRLADQPKLREMLIAILEDERRHKGRTEELLKSVSGRKTNP